MEASFWQQRWDSGQIGFHEGRPNDLLVKYVDRLGTPDGARALVPLCGKAEDVAFLAARGFTVTGVELVTQAVAQFFAEHPQLGAPESVAAFGAPATRAGNVTIASGDVLTLDAPAAFDAVYDRAALVALAPTTREAYVAMLTKSMRPGAHMLLVTFVYDQTKLDGPPFSLTNDHVTALFSAGFGIEKLEERDCPPGIGPKFEAAGIALREAVYLLERRAS